MSAAGPGWTRLFHIACSLIRQVNAEQTIVDSWSFGGGTAMMLQIGHRESHDVDIFLPDAQLLPFLDPKLRDFEFEILPSDYGGDGSGFIKLAFDEIGEIDFIVGQALTTPAVTRLTVENEKVDLETVAEIITKKIHYRGSSIKPRDIFDIAAAAKHDRDAIVSALKDHKDDVAKTLGTLERLNPDFVNATIAELTIKDPFKPIAQTALEDAKALLQSI
ncbi:nucleotidyl transferase AbiEii/AbiGii toxin family protein [Bradyrhizobium sp. Ec3.3]|uniref:nucleotidyl transferase AbiEii/AbiGii toxin family protein n=1 Tax=Bradyrhizobium sp. Ec3.3 TaxID=189753 RepID=UPI000415EF7A|nr:nucleotidyl transferase AbiEii/AbiGii toxin family protein [Bradyrhizobium sp. Ec3.3]